MADRQRVIDTAMAEVGYLEKATTADLDDKVRNAGDKNYTKYARDLWAIRWFNGSKQGAAWCSVFVSWCFVQAYGPEAARELLRQPKTGNCGAGCRYALNYFKSRGQFVTEPEPGDQIFFTDGSSITHTGLVVAVEGGKVITVEGNTSAGRSVVPNGGGVHRKSYALTNKRIAGYGRPCYGDVSYSMPEPKAAESAQNEPQTDTASGAAPSLTYTTVKGDTLWNIAKRYYGRGPAYPKPCCHGRQGQTRRAGLCPVR